MACRYGVGRCSQTDCPQPPLAAIIPSEPSRATHVIVTLSVFGMHVHVLHGFTLGWIRGAGKPIMCSRAVSACPACGVRVMCAFHSVHVGAPYFTFRAVRHETFEVIAPTHLVQTSLNCLVRVAPAQSRRYHPRGWRAKMKFARIRASCPDTSRRGGRYHDATGA